MGVYTALTRREPPGNRGVEGLRQMIGTSARLPCALAVLVLAATAALASAPVGRAGQPSHPAPQNTAKAKPEQAKTPPGHSGERTDQGVVQSIATDAIVVKELD